jgi:hypothetical protein
MAEVKNPATTTGADPAAEQQMAAVRNTYQKKFAALSDTRRSLADGTSTVVQRQQALLRSTAVQAEAAASGTIRPRAERNQTRRRTGHNGS